MKIKLLRSTRLKLCAVPVLLEEVVTLDQCSLRRSLALGQYTTRAAYNASAGGGSSAAGGAVGWTAPPASSDGGNVGDWAARAGHKARKARHFANREAARDAARAKW